MYSEHQGLRDKKSKHTVRETMKEDVHNTYTCVQENSAVAETMDQHSRARKLEESHIFRTTLRLSVVKAYTQESLASLPFLGYKCCKLSVLGQWL